MRHRDASICTRRLAAEQVQDAVAEGLVLDGFFAVALASFARFVDGGHARGRVEQRLDLGLDIAIAVVIGGLPEGLFATAVRDVVANVAVTILV